MAGLVFLIACWIIIPWLAAFTSLPLPVFVLLISPALVVIADRVQP
jgi:hypothetical protein